MAGARCAMEAERPPGWPEPGEPRWLGSRLGCELARTRHTPLQQRILVKTCRCRSSRADGASALDDARDPRRSRDVARVLAPRGGWSDETGDRSWQPAPPDPRSWAQRCLCCAGPMVLALSPLQGRRYSTDSTWETVGRSHDAAGVPAKIVGPASDVCLRLSRSRQRGGALAGVPAGAGDRAGDRGQAGERSPARPRAGTSARGTGAESAGTGGGVVRPGATSHQRVDRLAAG